MLILPTQHNTDKDHQNFTNTAVTEINITDRNGQDSGNETSIIGTKLYNCVIYMPFLLTNIGNSQLHQCVPGGVNFDCFIYHSASMAAT